MFYKNDKVLVSLENLLYVDSTPQKDKVDVVLGYVDQRKIQFVLTEAEYSDLLTKFSEYLEYKKTLVPQHININEEQLKQIFSSCLENAIINQSQLYSKHIDDMVKQSITPHMKDMHSKYTECLNMLTTTTNKVMIHGEQISKVNDLLEKIIIVD